MFEHKRKIFNNGGNKVIDYLAELDLNMQILLMTNKPSFIGFWKVCFGFNVCEDEVRHMASAYCAASMLNLNDTLRGVIAIKMAIISVQRPEMFNDRTRWWMSIYAKAIANNINASEHCELFSMFTDQLKEEISQL